MVPFHDLRIDGGETEKRPPYPNVSQNPLKLWKVFLGHDTRQKANSFKEKH